jgi:hypothetical protein
LDLQKELESILAGKQLSKDRCRGFKQTGWRREKLMKRSDWKIVLKVIFRNLKIIT